MTDQHSLQSCQCLQLVGLFDRRPQHIRRRLRSLRRSARGGTIRPSCIAHLLVMQVESRPILQAAEGLSHRLWGNPDSVKYQVQTGHSDHALRCVKITAINLGLRGCFGWVVCGNSLSGETRFAYRIGSFFNETPNGLRRGVIRDVPPEETPIPVIAERIRRDTKDLFETEGEDDARSVSTLPTIIEVPQWLARLEPKLAALDRDEPAAIEERSKPMRQRPGDPPLKQRELF